MPDSARPDLQTDFTSRRDFLGVAVGAGLLAFLSPGRAAATAEVRVLVGPNGDATREILTAIGARFPLAKVSQDLQALVARKGPGVYVSLGPAALEAALAADAATPVLSLFTSNEAYTRIVGAARANRRRDQVTGLFAEASPLHQLQLTRALYKRRITVAVLLSAGSAHMQPSIEQAARVNDVELQVRILDNGENIVRALNAMRDVQALLMIPDRALYTAESLRNILESAYRRDLGVIGFSTPLVQAGTLAAAYSTIDQVLVQASSLVDDLAQGRVPAAQYPAFWQVLVNDRVAHSLNVIVADGDRALGNSPIAP